MAAPRKPPIKKMEKIVPPVRTAQSEPELTTDFAVDDRLPKLHPDHIAALVGGAHPQPHADLGQHAVTGGMAIAVVRPLADSVTAIQADGTRVELHHTDQGLWQGFAAGPGQAYSIETTYADAPTWTADDPYRFVPSVGEVDLYLWGEGRHEQLWHVLGAHYRPHEGVEGTSFSVWAPHAKAARVVGDFNGWNGVGHAMRRLDDNGVWELFVPGLEPNETYKFELLTEDGRWVQRADPMARWAEVPPATGSRVVNSIFTWSDQAWLDARAARDPHNSPMSVYEVHLGSWRPGLGYREAADELIEYVQQLGFTHVEFMPLAEHPFGGSWGYQVTGYFAPTSRFGHPDDLKYLIDRLHNAGIGVIMDWVPGHFPKDEWALAKFDGQALYEHSDPRRGEHMDWGTLIFDFGQSQVRNFLVANALYWLEEFHIDGLRVDAVASMLYLDYSREEGQWLPNKYGGRENLEAISFLQEVNATAYKRNPGIVMIAEESTSYPGVTKPTAESGLGFGLKWNMGWMNDTLQYAAEDPMYRSYHHNELTFSFVYAFSENFLLPISHDEVVHGKGSLLHKMPGRPVAEARERARLPLVHVGAPRQAAAVHGLGVRTAVGVERGARTRLVDPRPARAPGAAVAGSALNGAYQSHPALWEQDNDAAGFEWLDGGNAAQNVVAFLRWSKDGTPIVGLFNFSGNPVGPYRVGLPFAGTWTELINTDAVEFGGSGVGNYGSVDASDVGWGGRPASVELTLPPLAGLWLVPA